MSQAFERMAPVGVGAGYWEQVRASGYALPGDRSLDDLTAELVAMIGDPDPEVRDGIAYSVLSTWLSVGVYDDLLTGFGDGVTEGLFVGLGEQGTDSVLRRSFSALLLAETVRRDETARVAHSDTIFRWGDRAASWFVRERDLRSKVSDHSWAHAVAHGADLLAALARSRHFGKLELTVLLDVIADRLLIPTSERFCHGEEDRLAYAVMTILHRNEIGLSILEPWVERLLAGLLPTEDEDRKNGHPEWDAPGRRAPGWPTASGTNTERFLRALHLQLALGVRGQRYAHDLDLFGQPPAVRADLLLILMRALRRTAPDLFAESS